jgi:MurNAc alpha-1-phosphate uridylyltransferase
MQAMILCAGRGERMRPLTDSVPKPMLAVGGRPLVQWTIARLARAGVRDLVINHAYLGHAIEAALGDGTGLGVRIRYSAEGEALETAGGIANARPLLDDAPFIVANGDVWCDFELERLVSLADSARFDAGVVAHLVLVPNPRHHPHGDFALVDGRLAVDDVGPRYTFSGIGLYRPALFAGIPLRTRAKLAPLLAAAAGRGEITAELHRGRWEDIGTPQRLAALDRELQPGTADGPAEHGS